MKSKKDTTKSKKGAMKPKKDTVQFISQGLMREKIPNTYESIVVAAREARRINLNNKILGTQEDRETKVTTEALERLLDDKLHYTLKPKK
ncbi:MAG: DNA-directed RNA polymerase subunit omega [Gemmatimonadota bacterium]|nr:DNA-directed RNA polymerase subunit omega [Gemmatimonadota bacterium]